MQSKTQLLAFHKGKHKPPYFCHPFCCVFSHRRMTAADCNVRRAPHVDQTTPRYAAERGGHMTAYSEHSNGEVYKRLEAILECAEPNINYPRGTVHRPFFLYELRWSQHQARASEMNRAGWTITTIDLPKSQWVNGIRTAYRLDSKTLRRKAFSEESPYMRRSHEEHDRAMPLFARTQP